MFRKYIVLKINGKECIFTFPQEVQHIDMFTKVVAYVIKHKHELNDFDLSDIDLVSAGFNLKEYCYSYSMTLDIESRGTPDSDLLKPLTHKDVDIDSIDLPPILLT